MNDNQWAAEWLGETNLCKTDEPVFVFGPLSDALGKTAYVHTDPHWYTDVGYAAEVWQPDSDLNHFKLVLSLFESWRADHHEALSPRCKATALPPIPCPQPALKAIADSVGSVVQVIHGYGQTMDILRACAFEDTGIALKAIRKAVEGD